jgi:ribosome-associated protein
MKTKGSNSPELLRLCCRALWEKKAEDLRILDVGDESSITDYLVLATGTSEPHLRALRGELEFALKSAQTRVVGVDTSEQSGWTVVDAFDVMVHLFTPEQREHYGLENLWKDAKDVPVAQFLPEPPVAEVVVKAKPKPKPKPKAKAKAAVKPKPKAKAKAKPVAKAKVKAKAKAKAKPKAKAKKKTPAKRRA